MSGPDDEAQCSNTSPSEPDDQQCADKSLTELLQAYEEKFKIGDRSTEETTARNVMVVAGVTEITAGTEEEGSGRIDAEDIKTTAVVIVGTETVKTIGTVRVTTTHTSKGREETTDLQVWL
ncbi:hypothetical protein MTO96_005561 [Rhipicephalus appendiculatus]